MTDHLYLRYYDVCKMGFFGNTKDGTPIINQYFLVYEFSCEHCMNDVLNTHGVIRAVL